MGWVKTEKTNKLSKLGDIDFTTTAPVDGNALVYDETNNVWIPGEGGGSSGVELTQAEYDQLTQEEKNNGTIYQISDKAKIYCLDEEYHAVKEITSADYALLSSVEKNNGTLYILTDEETTAADIPYSAGVSVADKLDALSEIGEVKKGAWTANSTSSYDTVLTNSISVTKGVWIISASYPNCSVSSSAYVNGIATNSDVSDQFESIMIGGSSTKMSMIVKFSGNSTLQLRSAGSTSATFTDATRGYLKAVKVAP